MFNLFSKKHEFLEALIVNIIHLENDVTQLQFKVTYPIPSDNRWSFVYIYRLNGNQNRKFY